MPAAMSSPRAVTTLGNGNAERGPLSHLWARLRHVFGGVGDSTLRQSLEGVIDQHETAGAIGAVTAEARSMLLNILEFGALRVDDVMVPRADIIAIDENVTVGEALSVFSEANHSRLPVYRETLDDPVGMVHIKDVLGWLVARGTRSRRARGKPKNGGTATVNAAQSGLALAKVPLSTPLKRAGLIRDILFVPPSMPAADLLVKMQSTRSHMAVVVDEYGGTDGLVSIEDIVEEIVGDIADEHDEEGPMIRPANDGAFIADARTPIEDLEEMLHVDLLPDEREEDADTLGGLLFSMLGRVPVRGELLRHDSGLEFEILEGDPRRLKRIKIHTSPPSPQERQTVPAKTIESAQTTGSAG